MARDGLHSLCEILSLSEIPFYSHWRLAVGVFGLNFGPILDRLGFADLAVHTPCCNATFRVYIQRI
jgi:hypothetical protein